MNVDPLEMWHFGMTEEAADALLRLVLQGKKKATSSSLRGYEAEGEPIPEAGSRSVITFWDGTPGCIVETVRVSIIPFCDISYDMAMLEGEDDSLESWQKNHRRFFEEEGKQLGYSFDENMPVVFEEFEVIEVL